MAISVNVGLWIIQRLKISKPNNDIDDEHPHVPLHLSKCSKEHRTTRVNFKPTEISQMPPAHTRTRTPQFQTNVAAREPEGPVRALSLDLSRP